MVSKLLSVDEAKDAVMSNLAGLADTNCVYSLISAVRHEERERAVKIIDSTLKIPFENYLDVQAVKKKILEGK